MQSQRPNDKLEKTATFSPEWKKRCENNCGSLELGIAYDN